jgi:hypothetical protein
MKHKFKWKRAIIVFCIVTALNIALACADYFSNENLPHFIYYLAAIVNWPATLLMLGMAVLLQIGPFPGGDDFEFEFFIACVTGFFSALVWAVIAGFRKSRADVTK